MSIKEHIDDAKLLILHARYLSALTVILVAVAASAEKAYPQGTPSKKELNAAADRCIACGRGPSKTMSDTERFTLFLNVRFCKVLGVGLLTIGHKDKQYSLEMILYKFFRCKLVHEGTLPGNVVFDTSAGVQGYLSISGGDTIVFNAGLLGLLIEVVEGAKCNSKEFGRIYREFVAKRGEDNQKVVSSLAAHHGITEGRVKKLIGITDKISCSAVESSTDVELCERFSVLVKSGVIEKRWSLVTRGIVDEQYQLLPLGIAVIRDVADRFELVET